MWQQSVFLFPVCDHHQQHRLLALGQSCSSQRCAGPCRAAGFCVVSGRRLRVQSVHCPSQQLADFKTRPKKITNPQLLMSFLYALNQWGAWRPVKTLNSAAVFRFGGAEHMLHKGGLVWKEGGEFQAFLRTFTPSEAGMRDRLPLNSDVSPAFDHV